MQIYGENDETVLWSSGTHARVVDGDRLRDWSEGGNERLARVTFGGNSIVESCKVIERCGGLPGQGLFPLPSLKPSFISLFFPSSMSFRPISRLINQQSRLTLCAPARVASPPVEAARKLPEPGDDGPTGERREELTNFQQVFSRFAAI